MLTTVIIVIFALGAVLAFLYNSLVRARNRKDEAWSDISVQLKRRHDLIPNLVNTVKGYAAHEKETFERVTSLRAKALEANGVQDAGATENMLTDALKSIFAVAENYPDLKASASFVEMQKELSDTENKIQASRRFYNATVQDFNSAIQTFPKNSIAALFRFTPAEFFELSADEKEAAEKPVDVSF
ncbi:MAG: LemA family protein [Candidatus Kaiserbacteria bacterium]|nr:LemA family protein [Candidatus Kaiserbacteria bacterium]